MRLTPPHSSPSPSCRPALLIRTPKAFEPTIAESIATVPSSHEALLNPPLLEPWKTADAVLFSVESLRTVTEAVQLSMDMATLAEPRSGLGLFLHCPHDKPSIAPLLDLAERHRIPIATCLEEAMAQVLQYLDSLEKPSPDDTALTPGYLRSCAHFAQWRDAQTSAGNRILDLDPRLTFRVGPFGNILLFWAAQVTIWVAQEDRVKSNEIVFSRPDIHSVIAYYRPPAAPPLETQVLLVREFRSPCTTKDGFVRELPGGSGSSPSGVGTAKQELEEETGLSVSPDRLLPMASRQVAATISTHHAYGFALALTKEEWDSLRMRRSPLGNPEEAEQTYPEFYSLQELITTPNTDWAQLGMILTALTPT
ncbi:MAG: hypothetical protein AAF191_11090 [Verrucomicrobiota bacterium]